MKHILLTFLFTAISTPTHASEADLDQLLFHTGDADMRTDAALIQVDGKIVYEKYGNGYAADKKHISWSTAKMSAGILMGIAADQGYFKLTDPVSKWVPEYRDSGTILDFLRMSSNLSFLEEYDGVPVKSDVVRMLYLDGPKKGFSNYTCNLPARPGHVPGDHYYYSSGDTNVLMEVLRRATGEKYNTFPWDHYFDRLGLQNVTFEQDRHGTFVGSSYLYLTGRDFARIGQLVANRGLWNGERIIPAAYWELMNTVAPGAAHPIEGGANAYSVQMHTNQGNPAAGAGPEYPELPRDALQIFGHQGQVLVMLPSQKVVIVRLGTDKGWPLDESKFYPAVNRYLRELGYPGWEPAAPNAASKTEEELVAADAVKSSKLGDWLSYLRVPKLIRTLGAKELCSCVFVLGRDLKTCKKDQRVQLPINPIYIVNRRKKTVRTTFVIEGVTTARYINDRVGCQLR